jgi:hypothetical protein
VKSHRDVAERWYPDLLAKVRAKEAAMDKLGNGHAVNSADWMDGEKANGTISSTA